MGLPKVDFADSEEKAVVIECCLVCCSYEVKGVMSTSARRSNQMVQRSVSWCGHKSKRMVLLMVSVCGYKNSQMVLPMGHSMVFWCASLNWLERMMQMGQMDDEL